MNWPWSRRRRCEQPRPVVVGNGRERSAMEALRRAEGKAAATDRLVRKAELLAAEVQRALGVNR